MRFYRSLALLLLLLPFSHQAKADLCADPTTHAWVTCAGAPALGLLGNIPNNTIVGNTSGGTAAPAALTSIPAALVPVYSGDCGNSVASSTLVCTQASGNFNVVGTLSAGTISLPSPLTSTGSIFTDVGADGVSAVNGVAGSVTTGTYTGVSCTGGAGSGLIATVVATAGTASSITPTTAGSAYAQNDAISCNTGSGTATGNVQTLADPIVRWVSSGATTNYGAWECHGSAPSASTRNFICGTTSGTYGVERQWLNITGTGTFGGGTVLTAFIFGNTSDNPTWTWRGTGAAAFGGTVSGTQLISTVSTGTAPLTVTSTTNVANLNASSLNGATFASPGVIGTTPAIVHGTNVTSQPTAAATTDAGNVPFTLFQSGVPFIIDTCTLGSTGGLTSCTSLPQTLGKSYMYFNASILASGGTGSTTGFYAVNMTSATAGQVCSPIVLYSSGTPTVPGTCNTFTPNATGVQTPPTSQITGPNISMPGHSMGLNGRLECKTGTQQNNSAGTKQLAIKWGSNAVNNTPTTITASQAVLTVQNSGSESVQQFQQISSSPTASTMQASAPGAPTSLDTTSAQTVGFYETLNTPATDFSVLTPYSCTVFPN